MSRWTADRQAGESLTFEACKGGYFSTKEEYGLRVVGKTAQYTLTGKNLCARNEIASQPGNDTRAISVGLLKDLCPMLKAGDTAVVSANHPYPTHDGEYIFLIGSLSSVYYGSPHTYTQEEIDAGINFYKCLRDDDPIAYEDITINHVQFELGETVTSYEPYCGGMPCPSPTNPAPIQCVKAGTVIRCGNAITVPCDLYEGDVWYPAGGKVVKHTAAQHFNTSVTIETKANDYFVIYWGHAFSNISEYGECVCPILRGIPKGGQYGTPNSILYGYAGQPRYRLFITYSALGLTSTATDNELVAAYLDFIRNNPEDAKIVYRTATPIIEHYPPQPLFAPPGTAAVTQEPTDLTAELAATMLIRRM